MKDRLNLLCLSTMIDKKTLNEIFEKIKDIKIANNVIDLVQAMEASVNISSRLLNIHVKARRIGTQGGEKVLKWFIC